MEHDCGEIGYLRKTSRPKWNLSLIHILNMTTPNTGEVLVQQAQEAERLRLLILADECKTIEEFREKLRERLNK